MNTCTGKEEVALTVFFFPQCILFKNPVSQLFPDNPNHLTQCLVNKPQLNTSKEKAEVETGKPPFHTEHTSKLLYLEKKRGITDFLVVTANRSQYVYKCNLCNTRGGGGMHCRNPPPCTKTPLH